MCGIIHPMKHGSDSGCAPIEFGGGTRIGRGIKISLGAGGGTG